MGPYTCHGYICHGKVCIWPIESRKYPPRPTQCMHLTHGSHFLCENSYFPVLGPVTRGWIFCWWATVGLCKLFSWPTAFSPTWTFFQIKCASRHLSTKWKMRHFSSVNSLENDWKSRIFTIFHKFSNFREFLNFSIHKWLLTTLDPEWPTWHLTDWHLPSNIFLMVGNETQILSHSRVSKLNLLNSSFFYS